MNLSPGTSALTRDERILALSIMIQQLQDEQRIAAWILANPGTVITFGPSGNRRVCAVVRDSVLLASNSGADDDDARAQAFSTIFTNEAAALAE